MSAWTVAFDQWLTRNMSCRRFAQQVAGGDPPLSEEPYRRFHFWLHWAICPFCRRYWREIRALGEIHRTTARPAVKITDVKQRLKASLRERFR